MKKKSKIIWFYCVITAFCFVIIFGMRYLGELSEYSAQERHKAQMIKGLTEEEVKIAKTRDFQKFNMFGLKEDLMVNIHDGRELNLKEALKGKVVVMVQYFSG